MGNGLRELWGLKESQGPSNSSSERDEFRNEFLRVIDGVNVSSQATAAHATPQVHQRVEAQRDALISAYQLAADEIDPADPKKGQRSVQRVMAAANGVQKKTAAVAQQAMMDREFWRARENDFSAMEEKIEELEKAGNTKAAALRKVANQIRTCADRRQYGDSLAGLDQLEPKLTEMYEEQFGRAPLEPQPPRDYDDLTDELARAEDFVRLWKITLEDVAAQVEALRHAMQGNQGARVQSIYEGLATVMQKFPDLDLSKLVDAARVNDRKAYRETLKQTAYEVKQVRELLATGPLLSTIDKNPYYKTNVHAVVKQNLNVIAKALRV